MLIRIDNWLNRNTYRVWRMWVPPTGLLIALSLLLPVSLVVAQQDEPIDVTRLGTSNSFVAGGAKSREEVQQFMSKNRKEVEALLLQKDWKGNPQDIFDAVANGDFDEAKYPIGTIFTWMAIRKNGVAQATSRIRWSGDDPFEAFEIPIVSKCNKYRFLIPKACGNFSLISEGKILPPNTPHIRVTQNSSCSGGIATIDITVNGMVPDDQIELELTSPDGSTRALSPNNNGPGQFSVQVDQSQAGSYSVKAEVIASCGRAVSTKQFSTETCGPRCNLSVSGPGTNAQIKLNEALITINMSGSSVSFGNIESIRTTVTATDLDGLTRNLEELNFSSGNMTAQIPIDAFSTTYNFSGEVRDSRGLTASCTAQYIAPDKPKPAIWPYFAPQLGLERRWRNSPEQQGSAAPKGFDHDPISVVAGGLGGIMFPVNEKVSAFAQFGSVFNSKKSEYSSLYADFGVNYMVDNGFFLGTGFGIWDINHTATRTSSFLIQGGTDFMQAGDFTVQWFIEGRLFFLDVNPNSDISSLNNYATFTGLRFVRGK